MRVNSINNNLAFGRVVKISNINNKPSQTEEHRNNTEELIRVLKNQTVKLYSKEEAAKIKDFFAQSLGDYNGKNEILYRKTKEGNNVIISGNEATAVLMLEMRQRKEKARLNKKQDVSAQEKENILKKSEKEINMFINRHLENGRNEKDKSEFLVKSQNPNESKGKIDYLYYENMSFLYSTEVNGHMLNKEELKNFPHHKLQKVGIKYNSHSLDLNK